MYLKPTAKGVLMPFGITTTASAADAAIQNKIFRLSMNTLIISKMVFTHETIYLKQRMGQM